MGLRRGGEHTRADDWIYIVVGLVVIIVLAVGFRMLPTSEALPPPRSPGTALLKGEASFRGRPAAGAEVTLSVRDEGDGKVGERLEETVIDTSRVGPTGRFVLELPRSKDLIARAGKNGMDGGFLNLDVLVLHRYAEGGQPKLAIGPWGVPAHFNPGGDPAWTFDEQNLVIELMEAPRAERP